MPRGGEQMSFASNTSAYTLDPHPFTGQTMEPPSSSPTSTQKKREEEGEKRVALGEPVPTLSKTVKWKD